MCNVCCKEFHGWCRAFTATEVILSVLEAILLSLFIAFLTFLVVHLIACSDKETSIEQIQPPENWSTTISSELDEIIASTVSNETVIMSSTVPLNIACTWTPSAKTKVVSQYFEQPDQSTSAMNTFKRPLVTITPYDQIQHTVENDGAIVSTQLDGKLADNEKSFIMALVKMKPPDDITYGCILTIISELWTLTAASCIESIEEVDSLDSFVIMENFGQPRHGRTHSVSDVLIHPQYQGTNKTYDIVALKSEDRLTSKRNLLNLPTMLDYLLITVGERLTVLGFGKFRSIDKDVFSRGARAVSVYVVPGAQCSTRADSWSERHLVGGVPAERGGCGATALCAGPLRARSAPCNYCAGTPLLRARLLLGLMSGPGPCGAPCEPTLYVNLAVLRDWLNSVLGDD